MKPAVSTEFICSLVTGKPNRVRVWHGTVQYVYMRCACCNLWGWYPRTRHYRVRNVRVNAVTCSTPCRRRREQIMNARRQAKFRKKNNGRV